MSIQLSNAERDHLEQLARRKIKPTRRQKAIALLRLAEGETVEKAAELAGIHKEEVVSLAARFSQLGLAGVGLIIVPAPSNGAGSESRHAKIPSLHDDALFQQYRDILTARRKMRAQEGDPAE